MVGNGAKFDSLTRWGVQALAKRMRQRKGAAFCFLPTLAFLKRHRNKCASVKEPISALFSTPVFLMRQRLSKRNETFRSRGTFILAGLN